MENIKKNPLSLQLNAEDFLPASNEEKQSLVVMRESEGRILLTPSSLERKQTKGLIFEEGK